MCDVNVHVVCTGVTEKMQVFGLNFNFLQRIFNFRQILLKFVLPFWLISDYD